eukprot:2604978-Pyramimonas_sp.AAC.1
MCTSTAASHQPPVLLSSTEFPAVNRESIENLLATGRDTPREVLSIIHTPVRHGARRTYTVNPPSPALNRPPSTPNFPGGGALAGVPSGVAREGGQCAAWPR